MNATIPSSQEQQQQPQASNMATSQEQQQQPQASNIATSRDQQRSAKYKLLAESDRRRGQDKFERKLYASGIVDYFQFLKHRASSLLVGIGEKKV